VGELVLPLFLVVGCSGGQLAAGLPLLLSVHV
jgi:hypothetical protein